MASIKGNLVVGQSGGPTMVINQSLVGVIQAAKKEKDIDKIYGALNGVEGILSERFIDLAKESDANLEIVANTPAASLGSCRHKPNRKECEKVFEIFKKYDVRYFFYIGGNDSAETAHIINSIAKETNYELRVFHIPKTIDNDLRETDHCPGYGSAAKYVIQSFMGNDLDSAALLGIKIDIVMGRNAGWLAAAAALAKDKNDSKSGPHLIYVPEKAITLDKFTEDIFSVYKKYGRCLVAVSEGIVDANTGKPFAENLCENLGDEVDSHGNKQLSGSGALGDFLIRKVKKTWSDKGNYSKLRVRSDTLGYAQRSFVGILSEPDVREARLVGVSAVKFAISGDVDGSIALYRKPGAKVFSAKRVELSKVAKVTKDMPSCFINKNGNGVTPKFIEYLTPLVGTLPKVSHLKGKINNDIVKIKKSK